jgi:hypothetical protein
MNARRARMLTLILLRLAIAAVLVGLGGIAVVRAFEGGHIVINTGVRP